MIIEYLSNTSYINMLIYIIMGYIFYYVFSISFVSIACLVIGIIVGSYLTNKFKIVLF